LSSVGGVIGIIVGVVGSKAISAFKHWPSLISPGSIVIAFLFSAAVGIFWFLSGAQSGPTRPD